MAYYAQIKTGEIYNTFIDFKEVGETVCCALMLERKLVKTVIFREDEGISCYRFGKGMIGTKGLFLEDVKPHNLSSLEKEMAERLLTKRKL